MARPSCLLLLLAAAMIVGTPSHAQQAAGDTRELVAVLDLDSSNATKPELDALSEELRARLAASGHFRIVDRDQIDKVLDQQALQLRGCASQECAVQVGKILGVRKLVSGRVTRIDEGLWQVSAKLVDVESAETLKAVTVNHTGTFGTLLNDGMGVLAGRLTGTEQASPTATTTGTPTTPPATVAPGTPVAAPSTPSATNSVYLPAPPPGSSQWREAYDWFEKSVRAMSDKEWKVAADHMSRAIALDPNEWNFYWMRAMDYQQIFQAKLALKDLDRAVALDPKQAPPHKLRAEIRMAMDQPAAACVDYQAACNLGDNEACGAMLHGKCR